MASVKLDACFDKRSVRVNELPINTTFGWLLNDAATVIMQLKSEIMSARSEGEMRRTTIFDSEKVAHVHIYRFADSGEGKESCRAQKM